MYINKIKLSGFKSFSEETTLSFDKNLNGIIGPNGSGKSNIVEAIKWVMGESSSKSLRGSGMNDIIFSGSATKASKNIAVVTLYLKVDSKKDISTSSKSFFQSENIEIERQITRDIGSIYRINGKEVKAKDVQFLFADLSSGSRASNIIDQGSIGSLVVQKPSERRRILDEAAGISGISARKTESKNKLEATRRNLDRLADILSNNKERFSELKKQADKAIQYKEAKEKVSKLERKILLAKLQKSLNNEKTLKVNLETNVNNFFKKKEILNAVSAKKNKLEENLDQLNSKNRKLHQENQEKLNIISQTNLEKENNVKQLESLKNLKEQIKKNVNFQSEILESSLSRLDLLDKELLEYKNNSNKKVFSESEKQYDKLKNEFLRSNQNLEEDSLHLSSKKELVGNKHYQRVMLLKKLSDLETQNISISKFISDKKVTLKEDDSSFEFEKTRQRLLKRDAKLKSNILNKNRTLDEYKSLAISVKKDIDKILEKKSIYSNKVNETKNQISLYCSLGFNNSEKKVINNIIVHDDFKLAVYLAIGDGIEASKDKEAPVFWNKVDFGDLPELPLSMVSLKKYVKGPREINLFLSQVGIVNSISEGNKIQKLLKPGQMLVSKEGSVWRWDGLFIKDGSKTITFKRIESTTKIIALEEKLKKEVSEAFKIDKIIKLLESKLANIENNITIITEQLKGSEKLASSNKEELTELERKLLIRKSKKDFDLDELKKNKSLYLEKQEEIKDLKNEIKLIDDFIAQESGEIVNIKKSFSVKNKENFKLKERFENYRIEFEINKKQLDVETIRQEKIKEEIDATKKQIKSTKSILASLSDDIKKAKYQENILLQKPDDSDSKILELNQSINLNKEKIKEASLLMKKNKEELDLTSEKHKDETFKVERLKEDRIRKEEQLEQLKSLIIIDQERIEAELGISLAHQKKLISETDFTRVDVKDTELKLRSMRTKIENSDDINLMAEKELKDLELKINNILKEEKDLNNAAKKLEKAIEELNKEARNRIIDAFSTINKTFSDLFRKLFDGGKAYLELIDSTDPLEAGLELLVSPPGKKLQRLSLLSGGEKALTSLALIFSTFINKQTPICILDEVDAPLDDFNVERFCNLLKETTKTVNKKFLVVTHNKITMGCMNKIYGVTMLEPGISKLVSVNLDKIGSNFAAE